MMSSELETASNIQNLERIVIEPLTRVEGHGKVTLLQDGNRHIKQARLHIVEFRGFDISQELAFRRNHMDAPTGNYRYLSSGYAVSAR